MGKRKVHPCNRLKDEHVEWIIGKQRRSKWWASLRRDVTKDMLRDFIKGVVLRWLLPLAAVGTGTHFAEKFMGQ